MVSEPAQIARTRSEHRSQEDTRTEDDHVTNSGWEQPGDHHEAKPKHPGEDQPLRLGPSELTADVRARSAAELGFA